jgi:hypothetical protein
MLTIRKTQERTHGGMMRDVYEIDPSEFAVFLRAVIRHFIRTFRKKT